MFHPTNSDIQAIALSHKTQGGNNGKVEYDNIRFPTLKGVDRLQLDEM
jgi:hypothetical protein